MAQSGAAEPKQGNGLQAFLLKLAAVGVAPHDTEEERERKASVTLVASRLTVLAGLWAAAYELAGFDAAAAILVGYAAFTLLTLVVFAVTKNGPVFVSLQYALILVAPFAAASTLGGIERSHGIYLFGLLAPLLGLVATPSWGWRLFGAFIALLNGFAFISPTGPHPAARAEAERALLVLNAAGLAWILFASLARLASGGAATVAALRELFRLYVPSDVGRVLLAERRRREIGGEVAEVTAMFADLSGFTGLSEGTSPTRVLDLLNRYFGVVAPLVRAEGGTLVQYQGDAFLALWNVTSHKGRHALSAARAALAIQAAVAALPGRDPEWPQFRIGINTGPAVVGNVGGENFRTFTAVGDAINLAARLQTQAEPGQVLVSATTYALIGDLARAEPAGRFAVRGRREEVEAFLLREIQDQSMGGSIGSS